MGEAGGLWRAGLIRALRPRPAAGSTGAQRTEIRPHTC